MSLPFPSTVEILSELNSLSLYCHIFSFYSNFRTSCFQSCSCPTFPSHFCLPVQLSKRKYVLQPLCWLINSNQSLQTRTPTPMSTFLRNQISRLRCFTAMGKKSSYLIKAGTHPEGYPFRFILHLADSVLWDWVNSSYHLISLYHLIFQFCLTMFFS